MNEEFFAGFNRDLHGQDRWEAFCRLQQSKDPSLPKTIPPLPTVDGQWMFNEMMKASDFPDPWMFPALNKLKESGKYILAALSNTVIFPEGHELYTPDFFAHPVKKMFDVFISSAHVGLRKPDPEIYQFAQEAVDKYARSHAETARGQKLGWKEGVKPGDVLFLDDIGENLKAAKKHGFRTLKVNLGRAFEAVDELEKITGFSLAGNHPKVPIQPRFDRRAARL